MHESEAKEKLRAALGRTNEPVPRDLFTYCSAGPKYVAFDTNWLPSLPQLVSIANEFGVPFESVTGRASNGSDGCDTCGYGSYVQFEWRIEL